jgi:6-phosphofructokinase 1
MRIGVLTGGGDVPGLNVCIKAIVRRAHERGWSVVGFRRGWAGPLNYDLDGPQVQPECAIDLSTEIVRTIDRTGGTFLHSSRTNPSRVVAKDAPIFLRPEGGVEDDILDCTPHVLKVLERLGIDALTPIGGDDTLSYAARLHDEGVPIVSIPKTMDNDVHGTDYCIGFSTAVSRSVEFITALRTSAGSHERITVVELFGRNSGETSLISGYLADADRVLIAETPFDPDRVSDLLAADRLANPSRYSIVVASEGAHPIDGAVLERGEADAYGHRKLGGIGQMLGDVIKTRTGVDVIIQSLAYLMRTGAPDSLDRMVASSYGSMAVQLLEGGQFGLMAAIRDGNYTTVPANACVSGQKRVDVPKLYDAEAYRPRFAQIENMPMFLY